MNLNLDVTVDEYGFLSACQYWGGNLDGRYTCNIGDIVGVVDEGGVNLYCEEVKHSVGAFSLHIRGLPYSVCLVGDARPLIEYWKKTMATEYNSTKVLWNYEPEEDYEDDD